MSDNRLEDALRAVAWYNGLDTDLRKILDIQPDADGYIAINDYLSVLGIGIDEWGGQLQMFWMILAYLFGDYGTSPRFGWITDIDGAKDFIRRITNERSDIA